MSDPVGAASYVVTLLPFLACVLAYARASWRRYPIGRVLMLLLASICAVLVLGVVARLFGDGPVLLALRVGFLVLLNVAGWSLLVQIRRLRYVEHPRRRKTDLKETDRDR